MHNAQELFALFVYVYSKRDFIKVIWNVEMSERESPEATVLVELWLDSSGAPILKVMTDVQLPPQQMSQQTSCSGILAEASSMAQSTKCLIIYMLYMHMLRDSNRLHGVRIWKLSSYNQTRLPLKTTTV